MNKGWFQDMDGKWYCFDLESGVMQVNKTTETQRWGYIKHYFTGRQYQNENKF
ncbi:MAG: hypothetical protein E7243_19390 [Lacrimispora celerecrescens]|nr:hypothetical protein [Lacrimispora celerecrescens]